MTPATWDLLIGGLLILMALSGTLLKTLPVSAAALYMAIGFAIGPAALGWMQLSLVHDAALVESLCEVAVLVSLFAVGLRLQVRTRLSSWRLPVLLATAAMVLTIAMLTAAGVALQWSFSGALLLAAILAPTDPVLASDVQVRHAQDSDDLRFGLTAEGGLNDGTAFAAVLLGLGLLGGGWAGGLVAAGFHWLTVEVLWAVAGGLALGWTCGAAFTRLVLFLQTEKQQAMGMESFLALGLIALTYGIALHAGVYGFLAVFVAGLSMRNVERVVEEEARHGVTRRSSGRNGAPSLDTVDSSVKEARTAEAMTREVLGFAKELEKFVELAAMLVIGCLLRPGMFTGRNLAIAVVLMVVARPVAVYLTTARSGLSPSQRRLAAWFGIRGVGSVYYLAFAWTHGKPDAALQQTADAVLVTVALSVLLHGVSATPLMQLYQRAAGRKSR